jgi:hypothetical protein
MRLLRLPPWYQCSSHRAGWHTLHLTQARWAGGVLAAVMCAQSDVWAVLAGLQGNDTLRGNCRLACKVCKPCAADDQDCLAGNLTPAEKAAAGLSSVTS